ncbi:hypothetical protein FRC17_005626 [Serendipita sp. 399]|nr:hypothetical protein FRC17_005626 [Serendipita sp. 399]
MLGRRSLYDILKSPLRPSSAKRLSNLNHLRLTGENAHNTPYSTSAVKSLRDNLRGRNIAAYTTVILSTAAFSIYFLQTHTYGSKLRSDAPSDLERLGVRHDPRKVKDILHGSKLDTQYGVDVEHILKRNSPIEDDHAEAIVYSPSGSPWHFWAVIDGHVGWETSSALAERLIPSVNGALQGLYRHKASPSNRDIDSAITQAFLTLDDEFVNKSLEKALNSSSRSDAAHILSQALSGAVALLAFYDKSAGQVKIALTGDLRAVRGRRASDGKWETTVLTVEQDGANEEEAARIRKEHPDEPDVIKDGRVLGWQPTRMFGDAGLKWSKESQQEVRNRFLGNRLRDAVKTPPYVTAEPVVTTADVQPGDFLILGCDGIWESLSSEEAVTLVGEWLDASKTRAMLSPLSSPRVSRSSKSSWFGGWFGKSGAETAKDGVQGQEKTVRYQQWKISKDFVTVDDNAATHLIRNSLGGADTDTMRALLTRTGSLARRLRDDMTVTVVFFGDSP